MKASIAKQITSKAESIGLTSNRKQFLDRILRKAEVGEKYIMFHHNELGDIDLTWFTNLGYDVTPPRSEIRESSARSNPFLVSSSDDYAGRYGLNQSISSRHTVWHDGKISWE